MYQELLDFGKAIEIANKNVDEYNEKLIKMRDYYISQIEEKIPYIKINGDKINRLPGNANISFRFIEGEDLILNLDQKGICASSGSACSSGSEKPSHVLLAIGLPYELAQGALRITFGEENTKEDVDFLINSLVEIVQKLRNLSQEYKKYESNLII